jgi:diguanylate cyclase (GGDEF)-like protein
MQSLFQLLNPLIFALFSAAFMCVYLANRTARGAFWLSLSYAVGAAAFTFDFFRGPMPDVLAAYGSNVLYAATSILFVIGLTRRYRPEPPARALIAASIVFAAAYSWFYFVNSDIWARSYVTNFGNGAFAVIALAAIFARAKSTIDRIILAIYAIFTAQFFIRPFLVEHFTVGEMTMQNYTQSLFFITLHLVVGVLAIAMAMTLLVAFSMEIFKELSRRSVSDALSGVLNRRGFEDEAALMLARDEPICVILADIDRFKAVNDTYGHAFGDRVIAEMGGLFRGYCNGGRIAGRLGGEEFALLLLARLDDARALAEAMRRKFASSRLDEKNFTASFGVAMRQPCETLFDVLARADEALYLAKESGRDRVACETDVQTARLDGALATLERRQFRRHRQAASAG